MGSTANKAIAGGSMVGLITAIDLPRGIGMVGQYFFGWPTEIGSWFGVVIAALVTGMLIYHTKNAEVV